MSLISFRDYTNIKFKHYIGRLKLIDVKKSRKLFRTEKNNTAVSSIFPALCAYDFITQINKHTQLIPASSSQVHTCALSSTSTLNDL